MLDDLKVSKSLVCNQDTSLYNNNVQTVCRRYISRLIANI